MSSAEGQLITYNGDVFMAFVTYMFSDEEKKKILKKYDLRMTHAQQISAMLSVNVYDSERNARLIFLSRSLHEVHGAFSFIWNEIVCCVVNFLVDSDDEKHLLVWEVPVIYIPTTFNGDEKELLALIQETFDNFIIETHYYSETYFKIIFPDNFEIKHVNGWQYCIFIH